MAANWECSVLREKELQTKRIQFAPITELLSIVYSQKSTHPKTQSPGRKTAIVSWLNRVWALNSYEGLFSSPML